MVIFPDVNESSKYIEAMELLQEIEKHCWNTINELLEQEKE